MLGLYIYIYIYIYRDEIPLLATKHHEDELR